MGELTISITSVIGSNLCIASDDGEKVHKLIADAIKRGDKVRLSFAGVQDLTSAFLNTAVGQLYSEFSEDSLKAAMLPPVDASPDDLVLLKRVVDRAKEFFRDPGRFHQAAKEILGDKDE
ncbi:MAG: STAS-like domain-containing protein [Candidatus Helarchaeota archaeon]|nr:STAS-like domain-containing protein [Candidatus Helarchaeota archaeon]